MDTNTIWVVTSEHMATRGSKVKQLMTEELSVNINLFLDQMGSVLEKAPEKIGKFHFDEFEVHTEISGKGTLAILGSGGEVGATGGLRFVFRRSSARSSEKF